MSPLRVVMCPINGIGIGHVQRCLRIADVMARRQDVDIVFISNTLHPQLVASAGYPIIGLPHIWKDQTANLESAPPPHTSGVVIEDVRDSLFRSAVESVRPNVVVFDAPVSVALMGIARAAGARVACITRQNKGFFDAVARKGMADLTIVPGWSGSVDEKSSTSLLHVGPIYREPDPTRGRQLRDRYFPQGRLAILVCQGGGGVTAANCHHVRRAGRTFLQVALAALTTLAERFPIHVLLSTGPFAHAEAQTFLYRPWLSVIAYEPHLNDLMTAIDVVVSTAGYNTVNEIVAARVPAVFLPIDYDVESQACNVPPLGGLRVLSGFDEYGLTAFLEPYLASAEYRAEQRLLAEDRSAITPGQNAVAERILRLAAAGESA